MVVSQPDAAVPSPALVVFFGSPQFAVPTLNALASDRRFAVRLVVTQPPRPAGRGQHVHRSAVHEAAERHGILVVTPDRLRGAEILATLAACEPSLFVVVAYGKILRPEALAIPTRGTLNLHASLLPMYRGASPIAASLLDGCATTGVSIMLMDVGLDTGPVLSQATVAISPTATTETLTTVLASVGAGLLVQTAARWLARSIQPQPQDDARATMTRLIRKEDGAVDWTTAAARIARMERAYTPWPGLFAWHRGRRVRLYGLESAESGDDAPAGAIVALDGERLRVRTSEGDLLIARVQPEGKAAMTAAAYVQGRPETIGSAFDPPPAIATGP